MKFEAVYKEGTRRSLRELDYEITDELFDKCFYALTDRSAYGGELNVMHLALEIIKFIKKMGDHKW